MLENVALLNLEYAIFHRIFPPPSTNEHLPPQISKQIIKFDGNNNKEALFLKSEITKVLIHEAVSISMDEKNPSPVPAIIKDILFKMSNSEIKEQIQTEAFVNNSISMAHQLNLKQDRRSTSGILAVLYGKIDKTKVLIIAKLEEGSDLQINEMKTGDELSLSIDIVEHIIRLQKATVLKVGIFYQDPKTGDTEPDINGFLCDTQNSEHKGADYYITDFLGCVYTNDSKLQTESFFDVMQVYIGENIVSPMEQVIAREKLSSFLLSESDMVVPKKYVETFIPVEKRKVVKGLLLSKNIDYNGFSKDIDHIKNKVEKMKILFENGITLTGASANFASEVTIDNCDSTGTTFTVRSQIRKIPLKVTKKRTIKPGESEDEDKPDT